MLAAVEEKRLFVGCKQNKLQTGQNSHLAVEPAAPRSIVPKEMC